MSVFPSSPSSFPSSPSSFPNKPLGNFSDGPKKNKPKSKEPRPHKSKKTIVVVALYILLLMSFAYGATLALALVNNPGNQGFISTGNVHIVLTDGTNPYGEDFAFFKTIDAAVPGASVTNALVMDFTGTTLPVFIRFSISTYYNNQPIDVKYNMNFVNPNEWGQAETIDNRTYYLYRGGRSFKTNPLNNEFTIQAIRRIGICIAGEGNDIELAGKTITSRFSIEVIDAEGYGRPVDSWYEIDNRLFNDVISGSLG